MLMNLKKRSAINGNRILSRNMEYKKNKTKNKLKAFQNVAIFKINSIIFSFYALMCRASRIYFCCLLISCAL